MKIEVKTIPAVQAEVEEKVEAKKAETKKTTKKKAAEKKED